MSQKCDLLGVLYTLMDMDRVTNGVFMFVHLLAKEIQQRKIIKNKVVLCNHLHSTGQLWNKFRFEGDGWNIGILYFYFSTPKECYLLENKYG